MPPQPASDPIESERRRLAHLLENHLIGSLNLLLSQAAIYEQTMNTNPQARMAFSMLTSMIRQTLQKARDLHDHLHPTILENLGLEPALESLVNQVSRASGLQIRLHMIRLSQRLSYGIELLLFRSVQTLLDHALDHHAGRGTIRLSESGSRIELHYDDDCIDPDRQTLNLLVRELRDGGCNVEALLGGETGGIRLAIHHQLSGEMGLTPRELDVLRLVAAGHSNKEVAAQLHIAARTVNFHLDNIFSKLAVNTRTEAVVQAIRRGWVSPPE